MKLSRRGLFAGVIGAICAPFMSKREIKLDNCSWQQGVEVPERIFSDGVLMHELGHALGVPTSEGMRYYSAQDLIHIKQMHALYQKGDIPYLTLEKVSEEIS